MIPLDPEQTKWAPSKYNEPCLSVTDVFAGDYHKAILVRFWRRVGLRAARCEMEPNLTPPPPCLH